MAGYCEFIKSQSMKQVFLLLTLCLVSISLFSQPPIEYGARFTGKYTVALTARYDGDWSIGINYNQRGFNGPFAGTGNGFTLPRPIDYNIDLSLGTSTFSGNLDLSLSVGAHQVYGDQTKNFGVGTGLYAQWEMDQEDDGGKEQDLKLNLSLSPGLHWNKLSLAPSFTTNLVGVYNYQDNEGEGKSEVRFVAGNGIGLRGDFILGNVNPTLGFAFNSYYKFDEPAEEPEEESFPLDLRGGINLSF